MGDGLEGIVTPTTLADYMVYAAAVYGLARFIESTASFFCDLITTAKDNRRNR